MPPVALQRRRADDSQARHPDQYDRRLKDDRKEREQHDHEVERRGDAEGRRGDRVGDVQQRCDDARDHDEVRERDPQCRQQKGGQDERVDHCARARMDCRNDEEPELLQEHGKAQHDAADDRELELGEDHVCRSKRVEGDAVEIFVHHPPDDELRRPKEHDGDPADRRERDDETVTELPKVLRKRHLLLIPRRFVGRRFVVR